jgi:hypothetical protein
VHISLSAACQAVRRRCTNSICLVQGLGASTVFSLVKFFPGGIRPRFPRAYRKADWHFSLRVAIVLRSRHYEVFWLFGLSFEIGKSLGAEGSVCLTAPLRLWMRRLR